MLCRQLLRPVVQHKAQMQRVTRTPYAPLAIDKALDPFLDYLARYIERAERESRSVIHPQIGTLGSL